MLFRVKMLFRAAAACFVGVLVTGLSLPHKRQAKDRDKDYRSYYSDELAELVANHFRRDIEALEYRFDPRT